MATDMIARALAAKAMQEAAGGGTEQFVVTATGDGVNKKSDKTPAEIAEVAKAGKQVVLKETVDGVENTCYLVNANNNVATFCGTGQIMDVPVDSNSILVRNWNFILNDKTILTEIACNIYEFTIRKGANDKYTSNRSFLPLMYATVAGNAGNVFLNKDGETFIGTVQYLDTEEAAHIYFPDYAKKLIYDLKWNGDENPSTYTFTEMSLGGSGNNDSIVIRSSTPNSTKKFRITVDDAGAITATEVV